MIFDSLLIPRYNWVKSFSKSCYEYFRENFIRKNKYVTLINENEVSTYYNEAEEKLIVLDYTLEPNTEYTVELKLFAEANNDRNNSKNASYSFEFQTGEHGTYARRLMDDDGFLYEITGGPITKEIELTNMRDLTYDNVINTHVKEPLVSSPIRFSFPEDHQFQHTTVEVSVIYNDTPYGLLNLHLDRELAEWLPFISFEDSEIKFRINESTVLVPFDIEEEDSFHDEGDTGHQMQTMQFSPLNHSQDDFEKMLNILENNNGYFEAELTYFLNHPYENILFDDVDYSYHLFHLLGQDSTTLIHEQDINDDMRITENLDNGAYRLEVIRAADLNFWDEVVWKQDIYVEKDPQLLTDSQVDYYASKYAPISVFHKDEEFFPISFEELFGADIDADIKISQTWRQSTSVPYSDLGTFLSYNGHTDYLVDFTYFGRDIGLENVTGSRENATVYYSYMERDDRKFINYHYIYAYDPKNGEVDNPAVGAHNFDRESITIELDHSNQIKDVIVSGHLPGHEMSMVGPGESHDFSWDSGRLRIPFNDSVNFPSYNDHPVIAVARGAHALFPVSGEYLVNVGLWGYINTTDYSGLLEDLDESTFQQRPVNNEHGRNILLPDSDDLRTNDFNQYKLERLDLSQTSDSEHSYLTFSGDMVDILGTGNEPFPPFTDKEVNVVNWVDHADVGWNWSTLPEAAQESIGDINEYILQYLGSAILEGSVKDAITEAGIQGADINVLDQGRNNTGIHEISDQNGHYIMNMPEGIGYNIIISKSGYIPVEYQAIDIENGEHKYLETIMQIPTEFANLDNAVLKGTVIQADNVSNIADATIKLRESLNATSGEIIADTVTDSSGEYHFENLRTGYYTMEISKDGFERTYVNVTVIGEREVIRQIVLNPVLGEGEVRIVLEWGETPRDLDSHLVGPNFHIAYNNRSYFEDDELHAVLDVDVIDSYGPETITIYNLTEEKTYEYYAHDYTNRHNSDSSALSQSNASVTVYTDDQTYKYHVPTNVPGIRWNVFNIENGTIVPINTIE